MLRILLLAALCLALAACHPDLSAPGGAGAGGAAAAAAAVEPPLAAKVRAFVAAANRQDSAAMLAATEPEFRWLQVTADSLTAEVIGHDNLRSWLDGYFRSTPDARSSLGAIRVDGNMASAFETVSWTDADGQPQRQTALSVYEFAPDGRLRRVWYFPAQDAFLTPMAPVLP